MSQPLSSNVLGLSSALGAYLIWGSISLYWAQFSQALPWEVVAHRVLWSLLFIPLWMVMSGALGTSLSEIRRFFARPREAFLLLLAALVCAFNWWINVYGVNTAHVVELGIGTFLTPLISVVFGVLFYRETLSVIKWAGVLLAACGVLTMVVGFGHIPWISFGVSLSWGLYGALKKAVHISARAGIFLEGLFMTPFALGYVLWLAAQGVGHFSFTSEPTLTVLLISTGIVASVPMVLFSQATQLLPMAVLGFCQYVAPIMTLLMGVFIFHEPFDEKEATALVFILSGIVVFLLGEVQQHRRVASH